MTDFELQSLGFERSQVSAWASRDSRHRNWPVVYTISNEDSIYIGETTNVEMRLAQHLASQNKKLLTRVNVIVDDSFNKSACLDLESHLIKYFHADEKYTVINGNAGLTDADYFNRDNYRKQFDEIFQELLRLGYLTRSIPELVNTDFFKYSPFKSLNVEQAIVVSEILDRLLGRNDLECTVIQGDPGTGKTIVAVYLMKLLKDIGRLEPSEVQEVDSPFADFFGQKYQAIASAMTIGLVIPQKSLRQTLKRVFARTPGLSAEMVLDPFEVGAGATVFDLLIVDEAHRLQQRANQPAALRNVKLREINEALFGADDITKTQLDWIRARSKFQILLLDKDQKVKPADLPERIVSSLIAEAESEGRLLKLVSQMRVTGGEDYIAYVGQVLSNGYTGTPKTFGSYDLRFFDSFGEMQDEVLQRDSEVGLARVVAGYAWRWVSKPSIGEPFDFILDNRKLVWNRRDTDWINSPTSSQEVGSIHTIQGYDLNYAGVIIGPDIGYDPVARKLVFNRDHYFDVKGKENNKVLGITYSDEDMLGFVSNIYRVLLTRGIRGTYIYVVDPHLRKYLRGYFVA